MYISVCGGKWGIHIWGYTGPRSGIRGYVYMYIWGFPKIRGPLLGVLVIRTVVYWGLYWGPLYLVIYHTHMW